VVTVLALSCGQLRSDVGFDAVRTDWETLAQRRTIVWLWALFEGCCGEWVWKGKRTGWEWLLVWVVLVMFGKLGTGTKEWISGSVPL
jgi:hypothetical protein